MPDYRGYGNSNYLSNSVKCDFCKHINVEVREKCNKCARPLDIKGIRDTKQTTPSEIKLNNYLKDSELWTFCKKKRGSNNSCRHCINDKPSKARNNSTNNSMNNSTNNSSNNYSLRNASLTKSINISKVDTGLQCQACGIFKVNNRCLCVSNNSNYMSNDILKKSQSNYIILYLILI